MDKIVNNLERSSFTFTLNEVELYKLHMAFIKEALRNYTIFTPVDYDVLN